MVRQCGEALARIKPDIVTVTEMATNRQHFWHELSDGLGDRYQCHFTHHPGTRSAEVGVVWHRRRMWRKIDEYVHQLSTDLGKSEKGLDNERWVYVVVMGRCSVLSRKRITRRIAIIATHWNGALQDKDGNVLIREERVKVTAQSAAPVLEGLIKAHLREGHEVHAGL